MKFMLLLLITSPVARTLAVERSQPENLQWEVFEPSKPKGERDFANAEIIAKLDDEIPDEYLLGPGDVVNVQVWEQANLGGTRTLGPDGKLSLPLVGTLVFGGLSRTQAQAMVQGAYSKYYKGPVVNLDIREYNNNSVFVLGRVQEARLIPLTGQGTLLEVISQVTLQLGDQNTMKNCAIVRGGTKIIWVSLEEILLHGNMALNLKLTNGDVVYLPQEQDAKIYVMGDVRKPGAYRLTSRMSVLDGLMGAGGPTENASKNQMMLIRREGNKVKRLRLSVRELRKGNFESNVALVENDIIFVGRRALGHFRYIFSSLNPFTSLLVLGESLKAN